MNRYRYNFLKDCKKLHFKFVNVKIKKNNNFLFFKDKFLN